LIEIDDPNSPSTTKTRMSVIAERVRSSANCSLLMEFDRIAFLPTVSEQMQKLNIVITELQQQS